MATKEAWKNLAHQFPEIFVPKVQKDSQAFAGYCYDAGIILHDLFREHIGMTHAFVGDIASGFHPAIHIEITSEYGVSRVIAFHELGHIMDYVLGLRDSEEMNNIHRRYSKEEVRTGLSRYATENIKEMIAEGFCEYMASKSPRKIATEIGELIDRKYREKTGELK